MTLLKILIVDDDTDILTIIKASFESEEGFDVKCVTSGKEAIQEAQKFHPDIILLDFLMPLMDGEATFKELQRIPALARVPVVFLTASTNIEKHKKCLSLGAAEIILKPFDPWTLPSKIRSILTRYRETRNPNF